MEKFLEKIIHIVVPHEKNRNVPHLLQKELVVLLSLFVVILFYFNQNNFNIIRGLDLTGAIYPSILADLTNQDRTALGVPRLTWSGALEKAARLKAEDMVKNGYFAHTSPSGVTPWFWLNQANYNFIYAGENLAMDFTESVNVEKAWLNSPTHRANVLSLNFTEIGIIALDGFFEGKKTTFVVEFFGKPTKLFKVAQADTDKKIPETKPKSEIVVKSEIAGVSIEKSIKIIEEKDEFTAKFISAQNINAVDELTSENLNLAQNKSLSTWYTRFIVNPTNTIKIIYSIILGFVLMAMMLMISKEYQRHHTKHLVMGVILTILIGTFLYFLNSPIVVQAFSVV